MKKVKTIIIGGGISGLYTAFRLQQQNEPFLLLEAKENLGGRILSKPTIKTPQFAVDLGPTWFWSHQRRMKSLIKELDLEWFEQYTQGDSLYQFNENSPASRSPSIGMARSMRVKGGMQKIITALGSRIESENIKTSHIVKGVKYDKSLWSLEVDQNGSQLLFGAERLILAVPPRIIHKFLSPENYLSPDIVQSLVSNQTWMSGQAKFVAVYDKAFWREEGLSGHASSRVGPMVEIHDATSTEAEGAALFGFIGVPAHIRKQFTQQDLKAACLNQLTNIFGPEAASPDTVYLNDWANEVHISTDYDINEPMRHPNIHSKTFCEELNDINLHFVASEFSGVEAGYLEGALSASESALAWVA